MSLILTADFLRGVCVAADRWDTDLREWPPSPDRLFCALVDAWGTTGADQAGRAALEWLESLPPPQVSASAAQGRDAVDVYVPPNDMKDHVTVLPALRKNRKPRRFMTSIPDHPVVSYIWPGADAAGFATHRPALEHLTFLVAALGHSSSQVRLAVLDAPPPEAVEHILWCPVQGHEPAENALAIPYPGRLAELEAAHAQGRRPPPGVCHGYGRPQISTEGPASLFGEEWVILADAEGPTPALEAFPAVATVLRDALMAHADDPPPEILSGHRPDGTPTARPHIAIVPLADVGFHYSAGTLKGLAVVLPRADEEARSPERAAVLKALAGFRTQGLLTLGRLGVWRVRHQPQPDLESLKMERYIGPSRTWATVTPMVLDRYPKPRPGKDITAIVANACAAIGLPAPVAIEVHRHSAARGAPSCHAWRLDRHLAGRLLAHMVLTFDTPVRGPVILGAGRFRGLGLCLPVAERTTPCP